MSIFDMNGNAVTKCYDILGNAVSVVCDINGNRLIESWDGLTAEVQTMLDTAMAYCVDYTAENPQAYAFPVITDGHRTFSGREPAYIEHRHPNAWSRFLFLGDMANTYDETQLNNAVAFMGSTSLNKIIAMGNHELGGWAEGDALPEKWYKTLLDPTSVMRGGGDGLIYYSDDECNNVRYIVLDSCTPIYKSSGVQLFTKNELEWCASAMESAGGKDIIICNHAMAASFYLVSDTEKTKRIYDTTVTNASIVFFPMVRAFIQKTTYNVTDDNGVQHTHDFSQSSGNFVGYFSGHYHNAGFTDENGFNQFTNPTLGSASSKYMRGMSFFIVDRAHKKIIWLVCGYADASIATYEYSYV